MIRFSDADIDSMTLHFNVCEPGDFLQGPRRFKTSQGEVWIHASGDVELDSDRGEYPYNLTLPRSWQGYP